AGLSAPERALPAGERIAAAKPRELTALVVLLALLGIGEDVIGGRDLLELLLRLLVAGIAVGVVFARQFPVGPLDLLLRGLLGNAQRLVELVGHGALLGDARHALTTTLAGRIS